MWPCKLRDLKPTAFATICRASSTFAEIIRKIGLTTTSTAYRDVKRRIKREKVDVDHIARGLGTRRNKPSPNRSPIDRVLASTNSGWIKRTLMRDGILINRCAICDGEPEWKGKPLVLRLDHTNGFNRDNRLENLRLVCPNCDSQLPTFSGRNRIRKHVCVDCGRPVSKGCARCAKCYKRPNKIVWPEPQAIVASLRTSNYTALAKKLGVSAAAIKKRLRRSGVVPPMRWIRREVSAPVAQQIEQSATDRRDGGAIPSRGAA